MPTGELTSHLKKGLRPAARLGALGFGRGRRFGGSAGAGDSQRRGSTGAAFGAKLRSAMNCRPALALICCVLVLPPLRASTLCVPGFTYSGPGSGETPSSEPST